MSTPYAGRTIPTTISTGRAIVNTSSTRRIKPGDFTYYTWDSATFTWDSATFTWDNAFIGSPATAYTGRIIP